MAFGIPLLIPIIRRHTRRSRRRLPRTSSGFPASLARERAPRTGRCATLPVKYAGCLELLDG